jgi:hypothetical protein
MRTYVLWEATSGKTLSWLFVLLFTLGIFHVDAQTSATATIVGTVTDPSGSAIPNATITATDTATGITHSAISNGTGEYVLPALQIGTYDIKVEAAGFSVQTKSGVVLNVGDRARENFALQVGAAQETVTVSASGIKLQTDSGEVSNVISGKQITQLESNGRSLYSLMNLTTGASSLQADFQVPTPMGGDSSVSFNGQRNSHNLFLLDGGETDDRGGGGSAIVMPSEDALAEFRQLTSNYSAQYGLSSAATISTVIKSGTRNFHASGWWFGRNDAFNARNYFNPQYNANGTHNKVAKLRFNLWGFNVGGPVALHGGGNPKTFFFYNMEWRSLIQGNNFNVGVPFTSSYGGDLSQAISSGLVTSVHTPFNCKVSPAVASKFAAAGQQLSQCGPGGTTDPSKGATINYFTNNTVPASLLDPNAQALLKAGIFPAPNSGARFVGPANTPTNVREEIVRIDHTFSQKFSIFGHYIAEQVSQTDIPTRWSSANLPTVGDTFGNPSYSAVVGATYAINSNMLNEARFTYGGNRINILPIGISNVSGFQQNRIFNGSVSVTPTISLGSQTGATYNNNWEPWQNTADSYGVSDDFSWLHGNHQFKVGGSWLYFLKAQPLQVSPQGSFTFNGAFTGYDFADFLLGLTQGYSEAALKDTRHWNSMSYALYFQDDWHALPRLTLNLGLRWDGIPHTIEVNKQHANFYPNLYNPAEAPAFDPTSGDNAILLSSPGLGPSPNPILQGYQFYLNGMGIGGVTPGVPRGLVKNHWLAFGPRIGFAYDVTGTGNTVFRGGFGIMYERIQGNDMYQSGANVPFSANINLNNVSLSDPHVRVDTGQVINAQQLPVVVPSITALNSDKYRLPMSMQYSLGFQHALTRQSVLNVSYVGNVNRFQSDAVNINLPSYSMLPCLVGGNNCPSSNTTYNGSLPYLGFHSILMDQNESSSNYNSLQASLNSNFTSIGLQLQLGYTYSKAMDATTGTGGDGFDLDQVSNPYVGWAYDMGPSVFDRTHVGFADFIYDLPFFRNSSSSLLKSTIGGWQLSGIVNMMTGAPLNLGVNNGGSVSNSICNVVSNCAVRPNVNGRITYPKAHTTLSSGNNSVQWFDPAPFSPAILPGTSNIATFGNLSHNALRGPGRDNWNLALFKQIPLWHEKQHIELRAESYNVFNHTQFSANTVGGGASGGIGSSVNGTDFGKINSAYDPRTFQFGAKIIW